MRSTANYLALDLGASSGRAVLGRFDGRRLTLQEAHRFPNGPVRLLGTLRWDVLQLFEQVKTGLAKCAAIERQLRGVGIDTWGVDFGLLSTTGELLGMPYHYRDARTRGLIEQTDSLAPREQIYRATGIQFMELNTLYQLLAVARDQPEILATARRLLFMPDLLSYWLTGVQQSEYTIASTSQLYDMTRQCWACELMAQLGLSAALMPTVGPPGRIIGELLPAIGEETGLPSTPVVAPACHDTGSAVAAIPAQGDDWAYISSGTWSLVGVETNRPICTEDARAMNFTNEGGACGTIRLLKNVAGLWLVQECRRTWEADGQSLPYDRLAALAEAAPSAISFIEPDDPRFAAPGDMPSRIRDYCRETHQPAPSSPGEIVRCVLESLALKYRLVLAQLEHLTGRAIGRLHIVGGGVKNTLLCQLSASVADRPVVAGPAEATAAGNIMVQALARGDVGSLSASRAVIAQSVELHHYEPQDPAQWNAAYERFVTLSPRT